MNIFNKLFTFSFLRQPKLDPLNKEAAEIIERLHDLDKKEDRKDSGEMLETYKKMRVKTGID